jgi:hypothetical protein
MIVSRRRAAAAVKKVPEKGEKKVPATKSGQAARFPSFGGWHLFLLFPWSVCHSSDFALAIASTAAIKN